MLDRVRRRLRSPMCEGGAHRKTDMRAAPAHSEPTRLLVQRAKLTRKCARRPRRSPLGRLAARRSSHTPSSPPPHNAPSPQTSALRRKTTRCCAHIHTHTHTARGNMRRIFESPSRVLKTSRSKKPAHGRLHERGSLEHLPEDERPMLRYSRRHPCAHPTQSGEPEQRAPSSESGPLALVFAQAFNTSSAPEWERRGAAASGIFRPPPTPFLSSTSCATQDPHYHRMLPKSHPLDSTSIQ